MAAKIIIVEDEVIIGLDLQCRIEALGHEVIANVSTGEDALRAVENQRPDLILMDINLAGAMDGIECAEIIRPIWNTPVVFVTAHADTERIARAQLVMPFGCLSKPIQDQSLRTTVELALYVTGLNSTRGNPDGFSALDQADEQVISNGDGGWLAILNNNLEILWAHPDTAESFGLTQGELVGRACHRFWALRDHPCDGCPAIEVTASGSSVRARVITANGREWDETAEPIFDSRGSLIGVLTLADHSRTV